MNTEQLIDALAQRLDAEPVAGAGGAWITAIGFGLLSAVALLWIFFGVNPDIAAFLREPMFWAKIGFGLVLALSGLWLAIQFGRPDAKVGWLAVVPVAAVAALWLLAAWTLITAPPGTRSALILGNTWQECLIGIPILSLAALSGGFAALRQAAPTRPAIAGALGGVFASGLGTTIYALQCPELAAAFLATWYVLAAMIPVALGALLGPHLLRW